MLEDPRLIHVGPGRADHECRNGLAPLRIGRPDDGDLRDSLQRRDDLFDLDGIDVLGSADDHVLPAAGDPEKAVGVGHGEVAGMPPSAPPRGRGLIGTVPVAPAHERAPYDQFADGAGLHLALVLIDDLDLDGEGRLADRADLLEAMLRAQEGRHRSPLGAPVRVHEGDVREPFVDRAEQRERHRLAAGQQEPQVAQVVPGQVGEAEHASPHDRVDADHRRLLSLEHREQAFGIEPPGASEHDRPAP